METRYVDEKGRTNLHRAAIQGDAVTVGLLLEKIKAIGDENEIKSTINKVSLRGNTALHHALSKQINKEKNMKICELEQIHCNASIPLLINAGASLLIKNNNGVTPFKQICSLDPKTQMILVSKLNEEKRSNLCDCYHELLMKENVNSDKYEIYKNIYFTCARLVSLKELMIAHYEFNESMPVKEIKTLDLLERMPVYRKKMESSIDFSEIKIISDDMPANIKLLNQERDTLTHLITDFQKCIDQLMKLPTVSLRNRMLAKLASPLIWLSYISIETALGYCAIAGVISGKDVVKTNIYAVFLCLVAISGLFGADVIGKKLTNWFSHREITLSYTEWQAVMESLQTQALDITESLQPLVAELKERDKMSITQVIYALTQIITMLKTMRTRCNKESQPLSLLFPPKIVDKQDHVIDMVNHSHNGGEGPSNQREHSASINFRNSN
ncbi:MAG: ankyrin repeat domain-containing protein [Gammaproteobacteria bacterium]|nr:MAG: ankyrin repeat domain-containing protein [Gammaproteobacteria bacterium]